MINCDRDIGTTAGGGNIGNSSMDANFVSSRYNLLSTTDNDFCSTNLSVIHCNCQSAINKRSEVVNLIDEQRPHILALTEFGASSSITDEELGIKGYTLYRGDHSDGKGGPGKGAALYVSNVLNHSAAPMIDKLKFDCSAWSIVKIDKNKSLLIGVVYRSPNSTPENNLNLL